MTDRKRPILAWHFVGDKLRDGRPVPPDGEWLEHEGNIALCESGLHASERAIYALRYAPGNVACRVECDGQVISDADKLVCTRRRIVWRVHATDCLRAFARWCATTALPLWDAPEVVVRYLETGDKSIRAAARAATGDARPRRSAWAVRYTEAAWAVRYTEAAWAAAGDAGDAGAAGAAAREEQDRQLTKMLHEAREGRGSWRWDVAEVLAGEELDVM